MTATGLVGVVTLLKRRREAGLLRETSSACEGLIAARNDVHIKFPKPYKPIQTAVSPDGLKTKSAELQRRAIERNAALA